MSSPTTLLPPQTSPLPAGGPHLRHDAAHVQAAPIGEYRHVISRLTGVQVLGSGAFVPPQIVTNADLAALGYDADWIVQRSGILERRLAADDVACSDLAYEAARRCLDQAGVEADQLDLIVVATLTGDSPIPSTACQLQRRLGGRAAAFDVGAACSGFMYALVTGMQFVKTGSARRVLVVGSEIMSRIINPADTKTFPLFGDGAGAVLLGAGNEEQGLLAYTLGADGSGADLLQIPGGGSREPLSAERIAGGRQYIQMEGRTVFKWAVNLLADSVRQVLAEARITTDDLSHFILHQANGRIVDSAAKHLGIRPEKVVLNIDRYGNTSAASIPLALDEIHRAGRLARGDYLLLSGFGAGLSWGTAVLRW
ncbi:MAG TPA: beta-ketoacyl-ACP synthase III [Pirellulaceae bacterium]|nr:beta-ketoacyl-ACP synthase III [Pirellulaceae bacterium]